MRKGVLITGASSGIGLETALHLSEHGHNVYASVPDPSHLPGLEKAAEDRKVRLRALVMDVTHPQGIESAVETVVSESGGIYGLVNNAGLGLRGFFEDLSDEEIRELFDVNVFGVMEVTRAVLPYMRTAGRGRIIIISSAGGRIASMTISGYCAGKFAIEGFGESLSLEVAPLGLHVSLIEPGLVLTPHFSVNRGRSKASVKPDGPYYKWFVQHEKMVDEILSKHRITPAHVARTVEKAIQARRPKLRYVVGWRAKLLIALRRHLPGEMFDRIYSKQVIGRVTKPDNSVREGPQLSIPDSMVNDASFRKKQYKRGL